MAKQITVICRVKGQTVLRLTDRCDSLEDVVLYYSEPEDQTRMKSELRDANNSSDESDQESNHLDRCDETLDSFSQMFSSNYHWRGDLSYGSIADYQTMDGYTKYMAVVKSVGRQLFVCKYRKCSYQSMWKNAIVNHIRTTHLSFYPFICGFPGCGKSFAIRSNLNNHRKVHSGRSVLSKSRELAGDYRYSHLAVNEKEITSENKSSFIAKTFVPNSVNVGTNSMPSEKSNKQLESISESIDKPFESPIVDPVTTDETEVKSAVRTALKSIRSESPKKPRGSPKPQPAFVGIKSVEHYIETTQRNGKTWRKCLWADCSYGTSYTTSIVYHIRNQHLNDKPYVCAVCGKAFAMSTNYKNHMRVHKPKQ